MRWWESSSVALEQNNLQLYPGTVAHGFDELGVKVHLHPKTHKHGHLLRVELKCLVNWLCGGAAVDKDGNTKEAN